MGNTEKFLDLYKLLEDELEVKYRNSRRRFSSIVMEFMRDDESVPIRPELDICREIRNLLTHSANIEGVPVIEPSDPIVNALEAIVEYVRRPPLALDYATKGDSIMKAGLNQKALRLMGIMEKNGYSHVPVMHEGKFLGVFSVASVFLYVLHNGKAINSETTLSDMIEEVKISQIPDNYVFLPKSASYIQAKNKFIKPAGKNKRVAVLFITENGSKNEKLLGMLTPWDVLRDPED